MTYKDWLRTSRCLALQSNVLSSDVINRILVRLEHYELFIKLTHTLFVNDALADKQPFWYRATFNLLPSTMPKYESILITRNLCTKRISVCSTTDVIVRLV